MGQLCRLPAIALAAALQCAGTAQAQDWPARPLTMVVPFAAGGAFDVMGRVFTPRLSESLRQQVIVENIGAASGIVGTQRVARAAPDGYVFLLGSVGTHAFNPTLYKKLPYNPATDFAPVALFAEQPMALVAHKDFPAGNLAEFIAGTNPTDPQSNFEFVRVFPDPLGGIRVEWSSAPGRFYTLQRSADLLTGFTDLQTHVAATAPLNSIRDSSATGTGPYFYRVFIE
jgi:hypothetical protein